MAKASSQETGIGFIGLLTIVFITLKLIGKIDWSWWWVLSPLWAVPTLIILVISIFLFFGDWD